MYETDVRCEHACAASLSLLGTFHLEVDGESAALRPSEQRLLAALALRSRVSRNRLAGLLWPETSEAQARTNLRHVLWRLQGALPEHVLIRAAGPELEFSRALSCDVSRLLTDARRLLEDGSEPESGGPLSGGVRELLPDWCEEWVEAERERLRQLQLHALEAWVAILLRAGRHGQALETALTVLEADVLRESAHRAVIRVHLAEGNVIEARRSLERCERVLAEELGVAPSAATRALVP